MQIIIRAVGVLVILLVAACIPPANRDLPSLEGTKWQLVSLQGSPALAKPAVTLAFDTQGKINGKAGCNGYFATYSQSGPELTLGKAGSTLMFCADPGVMDQETKYLTLLNTVKSGRMQGSRLSLLDAAGRAVLEFERQP